MRWRSRQVAVVLVTLLVVGVRATAQTLEDLYGRIVTSVTFDLEGRPDTSPTLPTLVDVSVGKPLTPLDIRTSMESLVAIGRYENVVPVATGTPTGVEVTFRLTPRHTVNRLEVVGESGISNRTLRSRVIEHYAGVPAVQLPVDVAHEATQELNDEGYLDATVTADVTQQHDPDGATLTLTATAGPVTVVAGAPVVEGTSPFTTEEVLRRLEIRAGGPYRRRQIETARSALEDDLRARGYYEAEVAVRATRAADRMDLRIVLNTGPLVEVRVEPRGAAPGNVDDLIPVKRERSADIDLLEDGKATIERVLRHEGHAEAQVRFVRTPNADNTRLTVTFTIDRGRRYFVDHVDVPRDAALTPDVFNELLRIRPGDVFDQTQFEQALKRVVDEYLRRGYYQVEAKPDRETIPEKTTAVQAWIVLHPNITEGPRAVVSAIEFHFAQVHAIPEIDLRGVMQSGVGLPYVDLTAARDREGLRAFYQGRGFLNAAVDIAPRVSEDGRSVVLAVTVNEGPQITIEDIAVVGMEHVSEGVIRDELGLEVGQPLSNDALRQAQQRLYNMGVFRRVSVTAAERLGGETAARVIVSVLEGPATSSSVGGGAEANRVSSTVNGVYEDHLEFAPRGFFEITRQNLGGRNRSLSLFTRVSLKPADSTTDINDFGFAEYRALLVYRERRLFSSNSDFVAGVSSEQAVRTSFKFARRAANAEVLHHLTDEVNLWGRYVLDFTRLFDDRIPESERPSIDRAFPQVRLSKVSTGLAWDRRDSPLTPTRGVFATADVEVAARAIGSEVGYLKTFLQGSTFHAIRRSSDTVLALRAQVGLARGFPRFVTPVTEDGDPVLNPDGQPVVIEVSEVPISQRFFAGGSTTVRGFQLDRLGIPGETLNPQGVPLGGSGLIVLNAEVRRLLTTLFGRDLGIVGSIDGGNVFARASDLNLDQIRGSVGFGVRWDSPLGPLRLDFGFKMNRLVTIAGRERAWEYHLSIGEAF